MIMPTSGRGKRKSRERSKALRKYKNYLGVERFTPEDCQLFCKAFNLGWNARRRWVNQVTVKDRVK